MVKTIQMFIRILSLPIGVIGGITAPIFIGIPLLWFAVKMNILANKIW